MIPRQVAELATLLTGVSVSKFTVQRACRKGEIPGAELVTVGQRSTWQIPDDAGIKWAAEFIKYRGLHARRCDAHARKGTGSGICWTPLDLHGQCSNASNHLEPPPD